MFYFFKVLQAFFYTLAGNGWKVMWDGWMAYSKYKNQKNTGWEKGNETTFFIGDV